MRLVLPIAAALLAAPLAAQPAGPLPGVANEETTIPSGGITQFHRGKGDVLFVLAPYCVPGALCSGRNR